MYKKVAFTVYPVIDLDRAREFYETTLGIGSGNAMGGGQWIEYDLPGGGCFAITSMLGDVKPSKDAGGSVALEVEDLVELSATLEGRGVAFKMPMMDLPSCKMAVIEDSEGNALILHEIKPR
jgi:predicted enzyme related to lactoylglutathione lyase